MSKLAAIAIHVISICNLLQWACRRDLLEDRLCGRLEEKLDERIRERFAEKLIA